MNLITETIRIPWTEEDVIAAIHDQNHSVWEDCLENYTSFIAVREIMVNLCNVTKTRISDMKEKFEIRERVVGGVDGGVEWLEEVEEFLDKKRRTNNFRFAVDNGIVRLKVIVQEGAVIRELAQIEQRMKKKDRGRQILAENLARNKEKRSVYDHLNDKEADAKMWRKLCCELVMEIVKEFGETDKSNYDEILQTKVPWGKGGESTLKEVAIEMSAPK